MIIETEETLKEYVPGSRVFRENEVVLFDPDSFFDSIKEIVQSNKTIRIDVVFNFENIDLDRLDQEVFRTNEFLVKTLVESGKIPQVPILFGFLVSDKFMEWGYSRLFRSPQGKLYIHPRFFYEEDSRGQVDLDDPQSFSRARQLTRPHVICRLCRSFFCVQDPYLNKIRTTEFKVPCEITCRVNCILNKYAVQNVNSLLKISLTAENNLDLFNKGFDPQEWYDEFQKKENPFNNLKSVLSGGDTWKTM